jgi:hypothetical protein
LKPFSDDLEWMLDESKKVLEACKENMWAKKLMSADIGTLERRIKVLAYCRANYKPS